MNVARIVNVDGHPLLVIYAKKHGTHQHSDIVGFTSLETGRCTSVYFVNEPMPAKGEDSFAWLFNKVQGILGRRITARSWDEGVLHIQYVHEPSSSNETDQV